MKDGIKAIDVRMNSFRRRYYLNLFIKGSIMTLSLVLLYYLVISLLEYNLWLGGWARFTILLSFFLLVGFCVYHFLKEPLSWWLYKKGLGEEESAQLIGRYFPNIKDKLLNLIQLSAVKHESALLQAGIVQKSRQFENVSFESAIDLAENKRYLKYFLIPFGVMLVLLFVNQGIFTQSTQRIVQFNREFSPQAPFTFSVQNESLNAFLNEDFTLNLKLAGEALPDAVYIQSGSQRFKMEALSPTDFTYTFEKLQTEIPFQFLASGFYSDSYVIQLINRPELTNLKVTLEYPRYLGSQPEVLYNTGNLEIPEGTRVTWQIGAANTKKATIGFSSANAENSMQESDNQSFTHSQNFKNSDGYWIALENDHSKNKDQITYSINVIKDQHPQITVDHLRDSVLYKTILLGGSIGDDYGVTALALKYQKVLNDVVNEEKSINIPVNRNQLQQSFFHQWNLDSLNLQPGERINYYLEVWDNDGVNGRKSTRSSSYVFSLPSEEEMKADITRAQESTENKIDESLKKAKDLRESIEEAQQKLKGKQMMEWQDKKMLEDLIKQKESLDQLVNELQKQNELLNEKKESLSEMDERIKEKTEQIQKLMDELLDEETKKMFEELEKLMRENSDLSQVQKLLDKMDRKEINLEKELERTLELFKQLQFDYKLDQAIQEITKQSEKQEQLLEKTQEAAGEKSEKKDNSKTGNEDSESKEKGDEKGQKDSKSGENKTGENSDEKPSNDDLAKEQEELSNEFDQFEKTVEELEKIGEEINKDASTPSDEEMEEVKDAQQQSKESLEQGEPKKSMDSQKKSLQKMKEMQQQLQGMQNTMQMEIDMGNLESLRQILHGLIKLSYDQESLMKEFNQIQQTDPKYVQLSQQQLKIKDDSKVLEDSLLSLAKRDPFMGSIVTREVGSLNDHVDKAVENIRERRKGNAGSEMQLSMTSINNLALMLNDHFDMMMDMMANAMPSKGKGKSKGQQSLGELQQQLNNQIQQLKNSGKSGRELSEELAKMAAEQERIRRALQEMQEKLEQNGGKSLGNDIPGKMEQTEMDLVNKRITEQTIRRQQDILTRLLEAEKSMREQNLDDERKG
ncbi:MAG TPA: DUF4175 family protein, partial [Cyclobacteriaceae bacterium]|nr:DUF4175 family protein [Cyclobacteriaceae bacterium]